MISSQYGKLLHGLSFDGIIQCQICYDTCTSAWSCCMCNFLFMSFSAMRHVKFALHIYLD